MLSGTFPTVFKHAIVKPLLKKTSLDPNDLKNFRPVSNLSFFSKLLEKVVMSQLLDHLNTNELWPRFQSAYRACHSTETALLRVLNDLLTASDDGQVSLLTLLDLSAAFDTIDHDILFHRLEHVFGIQNSALSFFRSYLTERKQMVSISGYSSNPSTLLHGVPQGSI
ncbi:reverse transcriptase domain-containing protein, partial [Thiolapillus sp.]|uniref:reverse transcriptase domain-containing protein n=1 Tax=Thiolapillus sp. TaxID=2017437 RepID=UPI0027E55480